MQRAPTGALFVFLAEGARGDDAKGPAVSPMSPSPGREFLAFLKESAESSDSLLCLELELRPDLLADLGTQEEPLSAGVRLLGDVLKALEAEGLAPAALRPILPSFESFGIAGLQALETVLAPWRGRLPILMEARFGDTSRAGEASAAAVFDRWGADAAIVSPWCGWDFLRAFLDRTPASGVYFLLRTWSRPGAWNLPDLPVEEGSGVTRPAWLALSRQMGEWGRGGLGAVISSSFLGDLAQTASSLTREQPLALLVNGVGEQGGDPSGVMDALRISGGDARAFRVGIGSPIVYAYTHGDVRDPAAAAVSAARRLAGPLRLAAPETGRREGPIRVFLVEDHELVRRAFRGMLEGEPDMVVTGDVPSAEDALERLPAFYPDVILLDLGLPGINGIEATRRLKAMKCPSRIVILSASEDFDDVIACLRAGAHGYMHKRIHSQELVESVRRASRGEPVIPRDMIAPYLEFRAREKRVSVPLSEREQEVLLLLARGATNREISAHLKVAEGTIKSHVRSLFRKLGISSREEAADHARSLGLL